MKRILLILTLALASTAAAQVGTQNVNCTVEGSVRKPGTGEPVEDVQITLNAVGVSGSKPIYGQTDSQGHFLIKDVPPGRYAARAQRDGYFPPSKGGLNIALAQQITIASGQEHLKDINFELLPGGNIAGRITGPDGKPIARLTVAALLPAYQNGQSTLQQRASAATDDRGEFRLFWLQPGDYLISAERRPLAAAAPGFQDSLTKTFFPGTVDQNFATPVSVTPGGELNASFHLVSTATFKISGRVINNIPNTSPLAASFFLVPRESNGLSDRPPVLPNQATDRSNGQFELRGVQPGTYYLYPVVQAQSGQSAGIGGIMLPRYLTGRTPVDVAYKDVEGITAVIRQNVDLKGNIAFDSTGSAASATATQMKSIRLSLRPKDELPSLVSIGGLLGQSVDDKGSFTFPGLPESRYQFQTVPGLPPDAYIADIRQGGKSVFDDGIITVGADIADPVQLVARLNGGSIEGTVQDSEQKPFAGARVTLIPVFARRGNPSFYKRAIADANGHYVIKGIAPGEYKIFAWDTLPNGADENPQFIAKYEERGQAVAVNAGIAAKVSVKVLQTDTNK